MLLKRLKIHPDYYQFLKLSRKGNLIPVYCEIISDLETPFSLLLKLRENKYPFLLESIVGGEHIARYSFLGASPKLILKSKQRKIFLESENLKKIWYLQDSDPLKELKKILNKYRYVKLPQLPRFSGGLVGYISYDMVRFFEKIPDENEDDLKLYDMVFTEVRELFIFDHIRQRLLLLTHPFLEEEASLKSAYSKSITKIEKMIAHLNRPIISKPNIIREQGKKAFPYRSNFNKEQFIKCVRKAKRYICEGEIIQVVLSQRLQCKIRVNDLEIYRTLRYINPSPYMYYLNLGNFSLIGSSPEVFVRCENRIAQLRPIAGTRKRGENEKRDRELEKELISDPKERAEHIMLVDLGRNDLGRTCSSVKVDELMVIEKYSHVMHIVSNIIGVLNKGKDNFDLIRATFPAGTVTGAPKIRAMEIIDELENVKRGPYAGCVGYFSYSGNLDTCITIRTILVKGDTAYIQAGAGIVADSIPEYEYKETLNKARALLQAIKVAEELK